MGFEAIRCRPTAIASLVPYEICSAKEDKRMARDCRGKLLDCSMGTFKEDYSVD
ncbi:hypothetical protein P4637_07455 [Halalkalibacterium halodurans]|uniref:hypothetical protein n=1 Tax=Halalkalibacterium halodurans TaxID=86665 RepID=UPI000312C6F7|nr:hypothetical protein [Halalkalibacterium halodurans]MDY7223332.1 hypothetical protein [Halalkalibacterium halodurans]MDY7242553.1 hypothetical protein [Halalkalibacterium halodurans]MED3646866.1 hypothetical protein [Halalkalibacterium halodurans]MED4080233.1 hypothetical protein [Halalkalibacterium halodurans]MED4084699.1 hypothetical protein [Halalkalibacterium halodurans]